MSKDQGTNELAISMEKILGQFNVEDLEKYLSNLDSNQMQQLVANALNMVQQNMSEEEREALTILMTSCIGKK